MARLELTALENSLHKMSKELGIEWVENVDSKEVNVVYNVAIDDCLELIARYMMHELMEERFEIEYNNTKNLNGLEEIFGEAVYNKIKSCISNMAEENFKLGFYTAFKMLSMAENYKNFK